MPDHSSKLTQRLIRNFAQQSPLRVGSLIVTIFGDSIVPRGGVVWLGSLIETLAPLGISHRRVRTAVYRLVQDNILTNEQEGRRSFYTLTEEGQRQFDEATERIYADPQRDWDKRWCMVLTGLLDTADKAAVRRDLAWLGFGQFGADVLAHPYPDQQRLARHLDALGCSSSAIVMQAEMPAGQSDAALRRMVNNVWDLEALEHAYARYIDQFHPLLNQLRDVPDVDIADAFYIRSFMIHEYRKVLLRDPGLPYDLLTTTWKGHAAYQLSRELYRLVLRASERFIDQHLENQSGPLPTPGARFNTRFGGL